MGKNVETDEETMEDIDSHTDNRPLIDRYKHYKRRHAHYKNLYLAGKKYKPIAGILLIAFILLVLVYVFNMIIQSSKESEVENLKQQNYKLSRSLEASESRLAEMSQQLGELENRYPELSVFKFDELIPLDTNYARSILLTKSQRGNAVKFQLLLENTGTDPLEPAVYFEFFNRSGEAISSIKLAFERNSQIPTILEPGALRSVSGEFDSPAGTVFFKLRAE
jgi:hypothetical protein